MEPKISPARSLTGLVSRFLTDGPGAAVLLTTSQIRVACFAHSTRIDLARCKFQPGWKLSRSKVALTVFTNGVIARGLLAEGGMNSSCQIYEFVLSNGDLGAHLLADGSRM